jgi:two-component system, OmpR family, KDP operon response regulator KdpE
MNQTAIRILVVDDESAIRRALRPPLVELGFQVVEASRGEEALQMLRAGAFDVVLLDVNMPGIGGIETLRRIRAFAPRLPILMLTVRDQEEDKVEALELGADDYVTKPFSTRELIARIRTAVRRVQAPARAEDAPIEIGECASSRSSAASPSAASSAPHAQGVRHSPLPDEPRRPRDHLRPAAHRGLGRRLPRRGRVPAHLRPPVAQEDRGRSLQAPIYLLTDVYVGYRFADAQMFSRRTAKRKANRRRCRKRLLNNQSVCGFFPSTKQIGRVSPSVSTRFLFVVVQQAEDVVFLEAVAALQKVQLDGKGQPGNLAAQLLHQLHGGLHGAAGGQQVVHQHHALAGLNRVQVNLQRVGAVFQVVGHARHRRGQFARLAHGHKSGVQPVGQRRPKDESPRLDAQHQVDLALEM